MNLQTADPRNRSHEVDYVASQLLPRAALLTRLLVRQLGAELSRSEVGLLSTLTSGPRRITELAELEGLAQPTVTLLVKRLEQRAMVSRERHPGDGRVVVVSLTDRGVQAFEDFRERAAAALHVYLEDMSDEQIHALAEATETLAELVTIFQEGPAR
jgi:DNA-binding MarR family transcriptional regulator